MFNTTTRTGTIAASALVMLTAMPVAAQAQVKSFDIPEQALSSAILEFSRQADVLVVVSPDLTTGKRSQAVRGAIPIDAAVRQLLRGSDLRAVQNPAGGYRIERSAILSQTTLTGDEGRSAADGQDAAIIVTGTRIRGGLIASPVLRITERQMREAGQRDLGDVIRSIPNNYNGGQNPGGRFQTGNSANTNVSGSSALNLRGLGPDATLTLLNGRRLAFDADSQAVDISAIPLSAVSEIQVVADGASALYGSDAVAGVANVILKRDHDGLTASARFGTATNGGAFQQAYDLMGGTKWASGGVLIAVEYERQNAVRSDQRDYTRYVVGPSTLLDARRHHGGLITAHQDLSDTLSFSIDALYSHRYSNGAEYSTPDYAATTRFTTESYAVSPTLTLALPHDWTATLNGFSGAGDTHRFDDFIDKVTGENLGGESFYENLSRGGELGFEGRLVTLPGGDIRLAAGGGYRWNYFGGRSVGSLFQQAGSRDNYYGFGELSVPLVSDANALPFIHELRLSGALRHEQYERFGGVTTPKLGLVYAPSADIGFKLSWGRSFKAPTLLQQFRKFNTVLRFASQVGGAGYPADATVVVTTGGNPDLRPETAKTLSATLELHPRAIQGLHVSATYFDVDYTDRVVQPLLPPFAALSSPVLTEFIDYNPTPAELAALIARDEGGLANILGVPYDPAKVVAIANGVLINAARQRVHGVDVVARYSFALAGGEVTASGQGSWLTSDQRNSSAAPVAQLAGTNFNPPKFRARGSLTGRYGAVTGAVFVNYIGHLLDKNFVPPARGGDMTTIDLSFSWALPDRRGVLRGLELALNVQNLNDASPPYFAPFDDTVVNYDSTNYSPLGRFISVAIRKSW